MSPEPQETNVIALFKGNSMSPRIEEGHIVFVSSKEQVRSGRYLCVVRMNDEEVLKKISPHKDPR